MDGIYERLGNLRQVRLEKAQKETGRCVRVLQHAREAVATAQKHLKNFCHFEKKEVKRLWDKILEGTVSYRTLMETREKESFLAQRRAALAVVVTEKQKSVAQAKKHLEKARQHKRQAERNLKKVEILLKKEKAHRAQQQERKEQEEADEFGFMRRFRRTVGTVLVFCVANFLIFCGGALGFTPQNLQKSLEKPVQYGGHHMPLQQVFEDLAASLDVSLEAQQLGGKVNGVYRAGSLRAFFDELGRLYNLDWYLYGQTLFVTHHAARSSRLLHFRSSEAASDFQTLWERFRPPYGSNFSPQVSADGKQLSFEARRLIWSWWGCFTKNTKAAQVMSGSAAHLKRT